MGLYAPNARKTPIPVNTASAVVRCAGESDAQPRRANAATPIPASTRTVMLL